VAVRLWCVVVVVAQWSGGSVVVVWCGGGCGVEWWWGVVQCADEKGHKAAAAAVKVHLVAVSAIYGDNR